MHGSENAEVKNDDDGDEKPQKDEKFALREKVSLAGFVDELGDITHGLVDGHAFEAAVNCQSENQPENAKDDAEEKQFVAIDSEKGYLRKIGHFQGGFTAGFLSRPCGSAREKAKNSGRGTTFGESTSQGPGTRKPGAH